MPNKLIITVTSHNRDYIPITFVLQTPDASPFISSHRGYGGQAVCPSA